MNGSSAGNRAKTGCALERFVFNFVSWRKFGAGEGVRTLDPNLGKVVLYH